MPHDFNKFSLYTQLQEQPRILRIISWFGFQIQNILNLIYTSNLSCHLDLLIVEAQLHFDPKTLIAKEPSAGLKL